MLREGVNREERTVSGIDGDVEFKAVSGRDGETEGDIGVSVKTLEFKETVELGKLGMTGCRTEELSELLDVEIRFVN